MPVRMAVPKEIHSGERRVSLDPSMADRFSKLGAEVLVQKGAGKGAHFIDEAYQDKARLVDDAKALYAEADIVFKVQPPTLEELDMIRDGTVMVGFLAPHRHPEIVEKRGPLYRNPRNAAETWSGKGKRPAWVERSLAEGYTLASLASEVDPDLPARSRSSAG